MIVGLITPKKHSMAWREKTKQTKRAKQGKIGEGTKLREAQKRHRRAKNAAPRKKNARPEN